MRKSMPTVFILTTKKNSIKKSRHIKSDPKLLISMGMLTEAKNTPLFKISHKSKLYGILKNKILPKISVQSKFTKDILIQSLTRKDLYRYIK